MYCKFGITSTEKIGDGEEGGRRSLRIYVTSCNCCKKNEIKIAGT